MFKHFLFGTEFSSQHRNSDMDTFSIIAFNNSIQMMLSVIIKNGLKWVSEWEMPAINFVKPVFGNSLIWLL